MRPPEYQFIRDLVYRHSRIDLGSEKMHLVTARLNKRLRATGIPSVKQYCDFLQGPRAKEEIPHLIDVISTNHTYFFREPGHFTALDKIILPDLVARRSKEHWSQLRVWSAACSSGEEPYSIAIAMSDFFSQANLRWNWSIEATDISNRIIAQAARGIFTEDKVSRLEAGVLRRNFQKGFGPQAGQHRIKAHLRKQVNFQRFNLLEDTLPRDVMFQVIFCRNVMIYFDPATQQELVDRLLTRLVPGGYLLVGHAESLSNVTHQLRMIQPATYQSPL